MARPAGRAALGWALVALVLAAGALFTTSCASSGDGGVPGTDDFLNRGVRVDPPAGTPPLVFVSFQETAGDATTTCIGIEAHRTSNAFAAAFSVSYDPTLLHFTGFDDAAGCLGASPTTLPAQVDSVTTPGRIVVGLTRNIVTTTTGTDGCGHLIDLCFDVVGEGEFDLAFVGNLALLQPDNTPVDTLSGADWLSSHVVVTQ